MNHNLNKPIFVFIIDKFFTGVTFGVYQTLDSQKKLLETDRRDVCERVPERKNLLPFNDAHGLDDIIAQLKSIFTSQEEFLKTIQFESGSTVYLFITKCIQSFAENVEIDQILLFLDLGVIFKSRLNKVVDLFETLRKQHDLKIKHLPHRLAETFLLDWKTNERWKLISKYQSNLDLEEVDIRLRGAEQGNKVVLRKVGLLSRKIFPLLNNQNFSSPLVELRVDWLDPIFFTSLLLHLVKNKLVQNTLKKVVLEYSNLASMYCTYKFLNQDFKALVEADVEREDVQTKYEIRILKNKPFYVVHSRNQTSLRKKMEMMLES
eukprot:snap_masked-scaffold_36-processed-gene-1.34-mRNA-1 protein AED:1.00 eAED:1.00 QI:0/-1/0/0/-1/1/1/0/319